MIGRAEKAGGTDMLWDGEGLGIQTTGHRGTQELIRKIHQGV